MEMLKASPTHAVEFIRSKNMDFIIAIDKIPAEYVAICAVWKQMANGVFEVEKMVFEDNTIKFLLEKSLSPTLLAISVERYIHEETFRMGEVHAEQRRASACCY